MMLLCPKCGSLHIKKIVSHKDRGDEYLCENCKSRIMENASYRRITKQQIDMIVRLRTEGLSLRAISRVVGCGYKTVARNLKKSMRSPIESIETS